MKYFDFSDGEHIRQIGIGWSNPTPMPPECIPFEFHILPALCFWRRQNWRGEKGGFGICFAFLGFEIQYINYHN